MTPSLMSAEPWVKLQYTKEEVESYVREAGTQLGNEWARRLAHVLEAVYHDLEFEKRCNSYTYRPPRSPLPLEEGIHLARVWEKHGKNCKHPGCSVRKKAEAWGLDKEDKEEDEEV